MRTTERTNAEVAPTIADVAWRTLPKHAYYRQRPVGGPSDLVALAAIGLIVAVVAGAPAFVYIFLVFLR